MSYFDDQAELAEMMGMRPFDGTPEMDEEIYMRAADFDFGQERVYLDQDMIGEWVTYVDGSGHEEKGRIKKLDNHKQVAWVVYKCNGDWDNYQKYTGQSTKYSDIKELQ